MKQTVRQAGLAIAVFGVLSMNSSAAADQALRGKNYLCKDAATMQLWDLSGNSELTRHRLLDSESCWKPMAGLHVEIIQKIGRFTKVQYKSNGIVAYAYANDIEPVKPQKPIPESTVVVRVADKLKRVSSLTSTQEAMLMEGRPTVNFYFTAGADSEIEITVPKVMLKTGLNIRASRQRKDGLDVGVRYKKTTGGLGAPDYVTFEIVERNDEKKYLDVRVGGYWNNFDRDKNIDLEIKPSTIRISGDRFIEAIRPHTAKELERPFRDFWGRTT